VDAQKLASAWHYRREWGFKPVPQAADWEVMGKALLICANGDGQLAPSERDWILGYMASKGAPDALLDELAAFDATDDVLALLPKSDLVNRSRRVIVFDAIRACSSDGEFHADERAAVTRMAESMGVSADVVQQLEAADLAERDATEQRIRVVYPDGTPL